MKDMVYIETTIPSFYYDDRPQPEMVARRNWTKEWWDQYGEIYQKYISEAVITELETGHYPNKNKILNLVNDLSILEINDDIQEISEVYINNYVMPKEDIGDALHLAIASYYKCDFLLTWNCRHIANANKYDHIKRINERLGLFTPSLITPLELLPEE